MRVFLKQKGTIQLYAGQFRWTTDPAQALAFPGCYDALGCAQSDQLCGVEIFCCFGDPHYDFVLPISSPRGAWKPLAPPPTSCSRLDFSI